MYLGPDLTHIRFAALSELEMMSNRATNIPWLQAIISSTLSIESYPRMIIQIHPSKNDFHSPGWKVLDVTIFAYQFLAHRKASKSQSVISGLRRPPVNFSWKLNDPINNSTVPRHLCGEILNFAVFPLYSSCCGIYDRLVIDIFAHHLCWPIENDALDL